MSKIVWNLGERLFHYLDKRLHSVTYVELDERCIELENQNERLEEALDCIPVRSRKRYREF